MRKTYKKLPKDGPKEIELVCTDEGQIIVGQSEEGEYEIPISWIVFISKRALPGHIPGFDRVDVESRYMLTVPLALIVNLCGPHWELNILETAKAIFEIYLPGWTIIDPLNQQPCLKEEF